MIGGSALAKGLTRGKCTSSPRWDILPELRRAAGDDETVAVPPNLDRENRRLASAPRHRGRRVACCRGRGGMAIRHSQCPVGSATDVERVACGCDPHRRHSSMPEEPFFRSRPDRSRKYRDSVCNRVGCSAGRGSFPGQGPNKVTDQRLPTAAVDQSYSRGNGFIRTLTLSSASHARSIACSSGDRPNRCRGWRLE